MLRKMFFYALGFVLISAAAHSQTTQSDTVWSKYIGSEVLQVKFSPDGNSIYVGAAGRKPFVLSTENGEIIREYEQSFSSVTAMDLSKDGEMLVVGGGNNDINIIETLTGNLIQKFNITELTDKYGYIGIITSITISIDKKKVYCVIGGHDENGDTHHSSLIAWNITENKLEKIENFGYLYRAYLSPIENCIALCFNNPSNTKSPIIIINLDSWQRTNLGDHTNSIQDIAFSPDGSMLASGDMDGVLKIWDVKEKKLLREITDNYYVYSVAFLNNEFLIMGSGYYQNHYLHILNSNTGKFIGKVETNKENDIDVSEKLYKCVIANSSSGVLFIDLLRILSDLKDYKNMKKFITPNPVDNMAEIKFNLNNSGNYQITIVNGIGKLVINIYSGFLEQGEQILNWDTSNVTAGTYYCRITGNDFNETLIIVVQR